MFACFSSDSYTFLAVLVQLVILFVCCFSSAGYPVFVFIIQLVIFDTYLYHLFNKALSLFHDSAGLGSHNTVSKYTSVSGSFQLSSSEGNLSDLLHCDCKGRQCLYTYLNHTVDVIQC
ncbi:hypothetical protein BsWGS_11906 [Bradybaena similaris]